MAWPDFASAKSLPGREHQAPIVRRNYEQACAGMDAQGPVVFRNAQMALQTRRRKNLRGVLLPLCGHVSIDESNGGLLGSKSTLSFSFQCTKEVKKNSSSL